jgi:glycosyltransferase involved in cell wall biosynthesis
VKGEARKKYIFLVKIYYLMNISIVIPAYNEEKLIRKTVIKVHRNFPKAEIIVVSDGSTDGTVNTVKNLQREVANLKLIEFERKFGKGAAILQGFKIAKGEIIGFIDADDAFEMKGIKKLITVLNTRNVDCVIASKWKGVSFFQVREKSFKKFASRIWNFLVKILFQLNFEDTQGGAKFLKRKVLETIGTNFFCKGFEMDVELLWRIKKKRYSIKEIFIPSSFREESKFSMLDTIPMFLNILKLKMRGIE